MNDSVAVCVLRVLPFESVVSWKAAVCAVGMGKVVHMNA